MLVMVVVVKMNNQSHHDKDAGSRDLCGGSVSANLLTRHPTFFVQMHGILTAPSRLNLVHLRPPFPSLATSRQDLRMGLQRLNPSAPSFVPNGHASSSASTSSPPNGHLSLSYPTASISSPPPSSSRPSCSTARIDSSPASSAYSAALASDASPSSLAFQAPLATHASHALPPPTAANTPLTHRRLATHLSPLAPTLSPFIHLSCSLKDLSSPLAPSRRARLAPLVSGLRIYLLRSP